MDIEQPPEKPPRKGRGQAALTKTVKMALEIFFSENIDNFKDWVNALENPKDKIDVWIKLLPYNIPKLMQVDATVNDKRSPSDFSDDDLKALINDGTSDSPKLITDGNGPQRRDN